MKKIYIIMALFICLLLLAFSVDAKSTHTSRYSTTLSNLELKTPATPTAAAPTAATPTDTSSNQP